MARKPRIDFPGAVQHVMLRGNARQSIFLNDNDRQHFCGLLIEATERFGCLIYAYCLMGNHVHMAIQTGEVPLARVMHRISFRYTQWFNHSNDRVGHVFQGRYKSVLVETDEQFLELIRYIHLNPVRAEMVHVPGDFPWSSHRAYLGLDCPNWLRHQVVLERFGREPESARRNFSDFVQWGLTPRGQAPLPCFEKG